MPKQQLLSFAFSFEYDDSLPHAENRARFLCALNKAGRGEYRKRYPPNPRPSHAQVKEYLNDLEQATVTLCADIYRAMSKRLGQNPCKRRQNFLSQLITRLGPYTKGRHKGRDRSMVVAARILDTFLCTLPYREALPFLDGRQAWWRKSTHAVESFVVPENGEEVYAGWAPAYREDSLPQSPSSSLLPTFPDPPRFKK